MSKPNRDIREWLRRLQSGDRSARPPAGTDPRLGELLWKWEEHRRRGRTLTSAELCRGCPELIGAVTCCIAELHSLGSTVPSPGPPRPAASSPGKSLSELPEELVTVTHFEPESLHGRGGLGEVYRARDKDLHRDVALKFIRHRHLQSPESLGRFLMEAEITSRLDHPGVVPILGLGRTPEDQPFYAMRFIRGETLKERIAQHHRSGGAWDSKSVEFRGLIDHFVSACKTIAYAHERGIVHCDVKPDNIMLGKYGETLVVDWGIATPVERDARARARGEDTLRPDPTLEGSGGSGLKAGTPAYMSPEQIPGSSGMVTPASDIYSLGATLHTLVTGEIPFHETDLEDLWRKKRVGEFPPPRQIAGSVPRPLEAICLRAMTVRPDRRYASAMDLAADLERWAADEPVTAYREPWRERVTRLMRRHWILAQTVVWASLVVLFVVAAAAIALGRMAEHERRLRVEAERARGQRIQASARLAAQTLGYRIGVRWSVLERVAEDPKLVEGLIEAAEAEGRIRFGQPLQVRLQQWIDRIRDNHQSVVLATSWFVTSADGTMLARTPLDRKAQKIIGRSFRYRHWYHGLGQDFDPARADRERPSPIEEAHLSVVFRSQANDNLMVAFTYPVRALAGGDEKPGPRVLGVLGMTVQIADFDALKLDLGEGLDLVLADLRETHFDDLTYRGLIVHHPRLVDIGTGVYSAGDQRFTLDAGTIESVGRLQRDRLAGIGASWRRSFALDREYEDPLSEDPEARWLAAFEPVTASRAGEPRSTGLVVIVQELQRPWGEADGPDRRVSGV